MDNSRVLAFFGFCFSEPELNNYSKEFRLRKYPLDDPELVLLVFFCMTILLIKIQ